LVQGVKRPKKSKGNAILKKRHRGTLIVFFQLNPMYKKKNENEKKKRRRARSKKKDSQCASTQSKTVKGALAVKGTPMRRTSGGSRKHYG